MPCKKEAPSGECFAEFNIAMFAYIPMFFEEHC